MYKINGVGPVLTNWCCVPAGTMIRSPALTSWSTPAIVALPLPEVKVRIWSTVCFYEITDVREKDWRRKTRRTSSPISPSTGTVISTS